MVPIFFTSLHFTFSFLKAASKEKKTGNGPHYSLNDYQMHLKLQCISGLVLKLIPCVMLTIFMTLLVRMLIEARERRTRLCCGQADAKCKSQAERTTTMLTAIVAVFLVTELPQGMLVFAIGKLFMGQTVTPLKRWNRTASHLHLIIETQSFVSLVDLQV